MREVGPPDVGDTENVDQELGQLVGLGLHGFHPPQSEGVPYREATISCWCRTDPTQEPDGATTASIDGSPNVSAKFETRGSASG